MRSSKRPADAAHVALDLHGRAFAGVPGIAEVAARTRVHRRHQHEAGGERRRVQGARDGDVALLQRLAQHLQTAAMELRQLVEEENAVMGQRDLARRRRTAAADHAGVADRVMRRAERPAFHQRLVRRQPAHRAVDARRLQALGRRQRRQDRRQPLRQHRLAGARRLPIIRTLWPPAAATTEGALGELLAAHVGEVHVVGVELREQFLDVGDHRLGGQLAGEDADRLGQTVDAVDGRRP